MGLILEYLAESSKKDHLDSKIKEALHSCKEILHSPKELHLLAKI